MKKISRSQLSRLVESIRDSDSIDMDKIIGELTQFGLSVEHRLSHGVKPCPSCGFAPYIVKRTSIPALYIECYECGLEMNMPYKRLVDEVYDELVNRWNQLVDDK